MKEIWVLFVGMYGNQSNVKIKYFHNQNNNIFGNGWPRMNEWHTQIHTDIHTHAHTHIHTVYIIFMFHVNFRVAIKQNGSHIYAGTWP